MYYVMTSSETVSLWLHSKIAERIPPGTHAPDLFVEQSISWGVCDHYSSNLIFPFADSFLKLIHIDTAIFVDLDNLDLHAGHLSTGKVGAMSRLRYQAHLQTLDETIFAKRISQQKFVLLKATRKRSKPMRYKFKGKRLSGQCLQRLFVRFSECHFGQHQSNRGEDKIEHSHSDGLVQ